MSRNSVQNGLSYQGNVMNGILKKSHSKSKFCVRDISDSMFIFNSADPRLTMYSEEVVILQIMLVGENRCIIEYVDALTFDKEQNRHSIEDYIFKENALARCQK